LFSAFLVGSVQSYICLWRFRRDQSCMSLLSIFCATASFDFELLSLLKVASLPIENGLRTFLNALMMIICNALMVITRIIETFAVCRLYRFH